MITLTSVCDSSSVNKYSNNNHLCVFCVTVQCAGMPIALSGCGLYL
jgi:hypothetical protein